MSNCMKACTIAAQQLPNISGVKLSSKDECKLFHNIDVLIYISYLYVFVEIACHTKIL